MKYIDSHAHYTHRLFNKDRDEVISNLLKNDVKAIVECGTNTKWNKEAINLAHRYDKVFAVIGYFPTDVKELENLDNFNTFNKLLKDKKVIGLGEIGFDFHHQKDGLKIQEKYFRYQLEMAQNYNLPVCIHSREAEADTMRVLRDFGENRGIIHCYAYGPENVQELVKLGYYFGVGGTSTYKSNSELREAIKEMPLNRILLETDAPYLSPDVVRRNRNDSSHIIYVVKELSKLKGVPEDIIIKRTNQNFIDLYQKEV